MLSLDGIILLNFYLDILILLRKKSIRQTIKIKTQNNNQLSLLSTIYISSCIFSLMHKMYPSKNLSIMILFLVETKQSPYHALKEIY